ncbi:macrophage mannose receptor 1-like [Mytilus californianus]|uniref:macrophage mannose receptor 1-like n=1 Tax=Mytilus californianus TaxID=6549 RepID=UPI002247B9FA|nr:macrophage mannose receptor 1-like [Mytilus californianus]
MDNTIESIYDSYEEPFNEIGYTHLGTISIHHQNYDDLQPTSSNENYSSVIADNKCRIKLWIAFTTVIILACAFAAGLTYMVIQSRYNTKVDIPSKESTNNGKKSENNGNESTGFQISESWTKCPNDWKKFEDWCYKEFSEKRTWFQARDYCRSIGTDLVSVHNEKETNFLINSFTRKFLWIGLSNFKNNGSYMWSDGTSLDYTYWGRTEPNDVNNNENCAHLFLSKSKKWNDNSCFMSFRFICKRQIYPRCGSGVWVYYKNSCYSINTALANFVDARNSCKKNNADLVIIRSKEEHNFIISQTTKHSSGADFWIGLQRLSNLKYKWIDGSNTNYLPWLEKPRGDDTLCIKSSFALGTWLGDYCKKTNRFICEKQIS